MNVPASIAAVITANLATLHELDTVYGVADLYRLVEIATVNAFNEWVASNADRH